MNKKCVPCTIAFQTYFLLHRYNCIGHGNCFECKYSNEVKDRLCPHFSIAYRPKKADILTKTQKLGRIDRG